MTIVDPFLSQNNLNAELSARRIYNKYLKTLRDVTRIVALKQRGGEAISMNDPYIKGQIDQYMKNLSNEVVGEINRATDEAWLLGNKQADEVWNLRNLKDKMTPELRDRYYSRNDDAREAFKQRQIDGLKLSDRVWKYTDQFKNEIEIAIGAAILDKVPAAELASNVQQYLREPHKLFRRVRDSKGKLKLSKAARAYHPGRGVYRSSYKNAMRTARTEVNTAYHDANSRRYNDMPFVVGFEVRKSANHDIIDICDDLAGKYPKEFVFRGWHPQCKCFRVSIQCTDEEYNEYERRLLKGERLPRQIKSVNQIESVPPGFEKWVKANVDRSEGWASTPYFIRDNFRKGADGLPGLRNGLNITNAKSTSPSFTRNFKRSDTLEEAQKVSQSLGVKADFSGMSIDQANAINESLFHTRRILNEQFNLPVKEIAKMDEAHIGVLARMDGQTLRVNVEMFSDAQIREIALSEEKIFKLQTKADTIREQLAKPGSLSNEEFGALKTRLNRVEEQIKELRDNPFSRVSTDMKSTIDHELGHAIQTELMTNERWGVNFIAPSRLRELGIKFDDTLQSRLDGIAKKRGMKLGSYATKNAEEYFSESWAAYMKGNYEGIDTELLDVFKSISKDVYVNTKYDTTRAIQENVFIIKDRKIDTHTLYTDKAGNFTAERKKLHDRIIDELLKEAESGDDRIFMLGGASANGKSTLLESGRLPHPKGHMTVDPDKIKSMLPEYKYLVSIDDPAAAAIVHEESSYIAKKLMDKAMSQKKGFVLDGVNDGDLDKLLGKIAKLKSNGGKLRADYCSLDTATSLKLAHARGVKTGRFIPDAYIKEVNRDVSRLIPKLIEKNAFDELYLWDTNLQGKPRLILTLIDGKVTIHDQALYERFLSKGV